MSRSIVLLLAVLHLPACSFGDKKRVVRYPTVFVKNWDGTHFRSVHWDAGMHPGPCPFIIRLLTGDLSTDSLSNPTELRRNGWLETSDGDRVVLFRQSPPAFIQCMYQAGRLVEVELSVADGDRVEVAVAGQWLALPATPDQVTEALGPPPKAN